MSRVASIKCDECGSEKKDSNGWFTASYTETGCMIIGKDGVGEVHGDTMDLCSHDCVIKTVSKWMA